jgi:putative aminopeptidase FrvX
MNWTNGIHDDYYNIVKAKSYMGGNETNAKIIWQWIKKHSNELVVDKSGNIIGRKVTI